MAMAEQPQPSAPVSAAALPAPFLFERESLEALAARHADGYRTARPFPHIVLEDMLPDSVVDALLAEFPAPDSTEWMRFDAPEERKLASNEHTAMGPMTRQVLAELNASPFVDFLETLTGIPGLVPDPHLVGGGLHQIQRGGHLAVHADFNRHPLTRLDRRLNLLLYLNRGWQDEWGGHLELWDREMRSAEVRIAPVANRCVIFGTTSFAYHGHPDPLECPPTVTRKSLALYYYSNGRPAEELAAADHNTLFQHRPGEDAPVATGLDRADGRGAVDLRRLAARVLPPVVVDGIRSVRRRRRRS